MEKVRIDEIDRRIDVSTDQRPLTKALGASDLALNYYELAPGDSPAYGYHKHERQEEVFYLQQGEMTFETEAGEVVLEGGEAIRFGPGEYQRGVNTGSERAVLLAVGAPQDGGDVEILRECPECGDRTPTTVELAADREGKITRCLACGTETGYFE
ncbi:cupin domain-containing protein [Halovenus sp. WSH3]|uniref:Cupin domain-containing protein n=1 Tax=Halovenus carboxidivorans TaxID=2692199 RepID=A0A6B0T119_9EURY|nr:cupin domain-containing protein [Halovenus carboxidivorans]MXR51764.1 cupin domain-containing protein [Halovenus carboxidivorans]